MTYITSHQGIEVPSYITTPIIGVSFTTMGEKTTVCLLKLVNGFEVVGTSACVNPKDFNKEIGEKWAFKQAVDKLEELDGFLRQSKQ